MIVVNDRGRVQRPRSRVLAAVLAFALGTFGVHKAYLKDSGGVVFFIFMMFISFGINIPITMFLGILEGFKLMSMSDEEFDRKYNRGFVQRNPNIERRRTQQFEIYQNEDRSRGYGAPKAMIKNNVFKSSGLAKYKDFDLEGAIEDFKRGLEIEPNDISLNFNIACAYSLTENKALAFKHLSKAVVLGFNDFDRIATHDDLAFVRIQREYEEFKKSGYKIIPASLQNEAKASTQGGDQLVLEQIEKLSNLRDRGLLTQSEYEREEQRLLNR
jgi:tetratricopeptide (TPR) repeat protein